MRSRRRIETDGFSYGRHLRRKMRVRETGDPGFDYIMRIEREREMKVRYGK